MATNLFALNVEFNVRDFCFQIYLAIKISRSKVVEMKIWRLITASQKAEKLLAYRIL
jgi:hypothetical protein